MKFRIIKGYKDLNSGSAVPHVNVRLEYFYHCWDFLLSENNQWFFFAEEKFESHRSLFTKIKIQLDSNRVHYPKQLKLFLVGHSYFEPTNILLRDNVSICTLLAISNLKT